MAVMCGETKKTRTAPGMDHNGKATTPTAPTPDTTMEPPWFCHVCHVVVNDQKLQKCPKPDCKTKRLQSDKPPAEPKILIRKEALKIIENADGDGGTEEDRKRNAEID